MQYGVYDGVIVSTTIDGQTEQALNNLEAIYDEGNMHEPNTVCNDQDTSSATLIR